MDKNAFKLKNGQVIVSQNNFLGGIQSYPKTEIIPNGYYFGYCVNYRDDPQALTLYPGSVKESGSTVTDLIKWGDLLPNTLDSYFYGNTGNIYYRNSSASWSNLHQAANSHGNGLSYFFADDYLYYTTDSTLGRYGPISDNPQFTDDFLTAQGGVPANTASLVLASSSSQYAHAASSTSLQITGDLTLETYFKAATLPTVGNSMALVGKWDESGATRSYIMDLFGVSGFFGDGSDGSLTISTNTTDSPIDSACTGTSGTQSLSATNTSFATGQKILIIQMQGTTAGQWEINTIQGYTAGTITLQTSLSNTYTTGAQVIVGKRYTNVTVNSGVTWKPKAWNGTTGGILFYYANGTITVNGSIVGDGQGFRGGSTGTTNTDSGFHAQAGEGTSGFTNPAQGQTANTTGGGRGQNGSSGGGISGGAGGGNGTTGSNGGYIGGGWGAPQGGLTSGSTDLTTMVLGGGGGHGGGGSFGVGGNGGNGGAILFMNGVTITMGASGLITSNGQDGSSNAASGGGGGAGGSILLKAQTATLGTNQIKALGGTGQSETFPIPSGGNGGVGRLDINYLTSVTGTTTPTINQIQDNTLVTTVTIQARLGISDDGTNFEYLTQNLPTLTTGSWNRLSIAWKASTSTANFYINGLPVGMSVGTKTSISSNASLLYVGARKLSSGQGDYFNGKLNDMRIWSNLQSATDIYNNNSIQVPVTSAGLEAYYTFNSVYTDGTANANTLTAVNSPTFDTADVPFPAASTALNIDTSHTASGQTYTLGTSISEATADKLPFTPINDPQQSIAFDVSAKGTGNWTVTIHDEQNRVIATQTVTNANMVSSGMQNFIFTTPWRIVIGKTYHAHLTSTVADGTVVTGTTADFATVDYISYFSFLVTDTDYHPIYQFLEFEVIGNERYLATWDGAFYSANKIAFPTGWRVRCFGVWREYLAIGVWKGTDITSYTHGRIYFWDGISPTFNFFIDVPDGQINALWGSNSDLFIIAGYRGDILDYQGNYFFDTGNSQSLKLRFLPMRDTSDTYEVFPGALNYYRNLLHIGFVSSSTSTNIVRGVYSYGTLDPQLPATLSCDYLLSTGNTNSTVSIGCVFPVGDQLIIGWQDGSAYGADVVDFTNNPAPHGQVKFMIRDDNVIWHPKTDYQIKGDFLPLPANTGVSVSVSYDRGSFETSAVDTTVGDTEVKLYTTPGRPREIQMAVDLYATGSNTPTVLGVSALHDSLSSEEQF